MAHTVLFCIGTIFLCMNGTIKLYSRAMYSLGCYSSRMRGFEIGLDQVVQCLIYPTKNVQKYWIYGDKVLDPRSTSLKWTITNFQIFGLQIFKLQNLGYEKTNFTTC